MNMFFQESSPCLGQTPERHPQGIQTETWAPNLSLLKPLHFHCSCWLRSCARGARTFILPVTLQENSQPFCLAVKVSPAPIRQPSCPFLAKNGQHLPPPWHPELHSLWLKFHVLYPVFTMSSSAWGWLPGKSFLCQSMRLLYIHSHVFSPPPCLFQPFSSLFTPAITVGRAAQHGASRLLDTFIHSSLRNPQQGGAWSFVLQKRNLRLRATNWQLMGGWRWGRWWVANKSSSPCLPASKAPAIATSTHSLWWRTLRPPAVFHLHFLPRKASISTFMVTSLPVSGDDYPSSPERPISPPVFLFHLEFNFIPLAPRSCSMNSSPLCVLLFRVPLLPSPLTCPNLFHYSSKQTDEKTLIWFLNNNRITIWPSDSTSRCIPERIENSLTLVYKCS